MQKFLKEKEIALAFDNCVEAYKHSLLDIAGIANDIINWGRPNKDYSCYFEHFFDYVTFDKKVCELLEAQKPFLNFVIKMQVEGSAEALKKKEMRLQKLEYMRNRIKSLFKTFSKGLDERFLDFVIWDENFEISQNFIEFMQENDARLEK